MHGKTPIMRRGLAAVSLFFLILAGSPLLAKEADPGKENTSEHNLEKFFPNLWEEEKDIWSAPFRKSTWGGAPAWIFSGAIAGSLALDDGFSRNLREDPSFNDFNKIVSSDGVKWAMWAYPAASLALGYAIENRDYRDYGWKLSEGAVNAFLVSKATKFIAGRERPHTGKTYGFREGGNSFPSGHSIIAWTLAEVTVKHFHDKKWVPWVAYPVAGLVSFSRITSGNHFTSDAVAGSIIGFSIGHWAIK